MDANQTRFHLVFGQGDWFGDNVTSPLPSTEIEWRPSDSTVGLKQSVFVFQVAPGAEKLTAADRRGAAQDQFGNYYWVSPGQDEILFLANGQQAAQHFWSAGDWISSPGSAVLGAFSPLSVKPAPAFRFGGLAVTSDHYLLVGTMEPPGLLLFDLYSGAPPMQYLWPADVPFAPFDIAAGVDGGAWILDSAHTQYWGLDPYFRLVTPVSNPTSSPSSKGTFQPLAGSVDLEPQCEPAEVITSAQAMPVAAIAPIGIAALPDGSVLILDNPPGSDHSRIVHYSMAAEIGAPVQLDQIDIGQAAPYRLLGQDVAFVPAVQQSAGKVIGTLYIADAAGAQTFAFNYDSGNDAWAVEPDTQFLPMLRFGGKALVSSSAGVSYDFDARWAPLVKQPRARYATQGTWVLPQIDASANQNGAAPAFDGKTPGCVWHRLLMDAIIPPGTHVLVSSRAADTRSALSAMDWNPEPQPYLRFNGPELPYYRPRLDLCASRAGTWELLFQAATGRYLQIQLTFIGNGRTTPRIQALRVYYPRFSYLAHYLPAVYQDNPTSASFLDRYLANPEGFFTVLEGRIQNAQELFDPRTIPAEYLDWLASWLGIVFDFTWNTKTRRFFLRNAKRFFQSRGTPDGMVRMIRLSLDACANDALFDPADLSHFSVRIVEHYLLRQAPGVTFGDPTAAQTPGIQTTNSAWNPAQGSSSLDQAFRAFLSTTYASIDALNQAWQIKYSSFADPTLQLPAVQPLQSAQAADWLRFTAGDIGFTYAPVTQSDVAAYQQFLTAQYNDVSTLNHAYNLTGSLALASFDDVTAKLWCATLVLRLPPGGAFLEDWILFVSVVFPNAQDAHRFSVIVPVQLQDSLSTQIQRSNLVQRIVQNEKPAHTNFDVKLYWAAFCAGEARVGLETVVGPSARFVPMSLDQNQLAASYLAFIPPSNATGRIVSGRDQLTPHNGTPSGEPRL